MERPKWGLKVRDEERGCRFCGRYWDTAEGALSWLFPSSGGDSTTMLCTLVSRGESFRGSTNNYLECAGGIEARNKLPIVLYGNYLIICFHGDE